MRPHRVNSLLSISPCAPVLWTCLLLGCVATTADAADAVLQTKYLRLVVRDDGRAMEFVDRQSGTNYVSPEHPPCVWLRKSGQLLPATHLAAHDGQWAVTFADRDVQVVLRTEAKEHYLRIEVVSATGDGIEELLLLDLPLSLRGAVDEPFAACALALNLQTNVQRLPQPVDRLQAGCYPRFGLAGAAVAVIACPPGALRAGLQAAVREAPDLPQSPLGGPWALDAPLNRGSYLFNFDGITEESVDRWIELARSLGITQIDFHGGQSFRFGDCRPNPVRYPQGHASLKTVIDRLHAAGIAAGLHPYAFFIAKDCPWVTPVPDPRLASDAVFTLAQPISAEATDITVDETTQNVSAVTGFFVRNSVTLRIEDELITYTGVQSNAPFGFRGCQRGAYGTKASAHAQGAKAYHLKECFGLFVPDPETTLLEEVAACTAETYNACGFDMIYLDALDGEDILGGAENGWHYGSKFVYLLWQRLQKPALMEMSTFHHHLWCVRSRYGAWDHPSRSHKEFIDLHCASNEAARRLFLPGELGWWALKSWGGPQIEPTFDDDIEYLMTKGLATDTGFALMGIDPETARNVPALPRLANIIKRYEDLRHAGVVPESLKAELRQPGRDFTLLGDVSGDWRFLPADYLKHRVADGSGPGCAWQVQNRFAAQPLRFRLEALMAAGPYDAPHNPILAEFRTADEFATGSAQSGVSAELLPSTEVTRADVASGCYAAHSTHPLPTAAWVSREKPFDPPLNLSQSQALGVWVHGDGQGEILNVQLRSPEHLVGNLADHYIPIDFTGWQYFELIEPEGRAWSQYQWPYGNVYAIYRESIQHAQVSALHLWQNNLQPGRKTRCYLSPIRALPLVSTRLIRPTIRVGETSLTLPVEIESGSYLEFRSLDDCKLYGPQGQLIQSVQPEGSVPLLAAGDNRIDFHCEAPPGIRARALVTVMTQGEPLPVARP